MYLKILLLLLPFLLLFSTHTWAASGCYDGVKNCEFSNFGRGRSESSSSGGGKVKINPAAVPTEEGFGVESITFKSETDFGLVRGNGRIGAAISPSNSEETFFGPPGFSFDQDLFDRKYYGKKFPSQKLNLATAINIFKKSGSGLKDYSLKLGLMGRYNKISKGVTPGGGLTGTLGPFSFGYSVYKDETVLYDPNFPLDDQYKVDYKYQVSTRSIGLYLSAISLDYSHLELDTDNVASVDLFTATLLLGKFIITASKRFEDSVLPAYDYTTKQLVTQQYKYETFGGVQYLMTKNLMLGALYNYYLLREYSVTATLFF